MQYLLAAIDQSEPGNALAIIASVLRIFQTNANSFGRYPTAGKETTKRGTPESAAETHAVCCQLFDGLRREMRYEIGSPRVPMLFYTPTLLLTRSPSQTLIHRSPALHFLALPKGQANHEAVPT